MGRFFQLIFVQSETGSLHVLQCNALDYTPDFTWFYPKILEKSGNFVSPEKWEPWRGYQDFFLVLIMFARSTLKIQINGAVLLKLDVLQLI